MKLFEGHGKSCLEGNPQTLRGVRCCFISIVISIIPKLIISKQENREYDLDNNLLTEDINNITLKETLSKLI